MSDKFKIVLPAIIIFLFGFNTLIFAQKYHFTIKIDNHSELQKLTNIISIDNVQDSLVSAYANEEAYNVLLDLGYKPFPIRAEKTTFSLETPKNNANTIDWNSYPSYNQYAAMMANFAESHDSICILDTMGFSGSGKPILVIKISDNVMIDEPEPEFFYSAQIHGDELLTYMLMLRLIDYLLHNYSIDERITRLINSTEIWINPLFNPDGTYNGQDTTVNSAKRFNANGVDINRNFPDFYAGEHPDHNEYQPETLALMDFAKKHHIVMSANLHSGSELLNYPWDTWETLSADDQWWQKVCRSYVDTVRVFAPAGYLTAQKDGITNGYDWYCIQGGRQDYMNYYHHCREVTMELSYTKMLPDSLLTDYWLYNKNALLSYIEEVHKGVNGVVKNKIGQPLAAKITIPDYDFDNSEVYSDSIYGRFHRLLLPGIYPLLIETAGYSSVKLDNITVNDTAAAATLNIVMNRKPQIASIFPQDIDTVILNKGYLFKVSIIDLDGDSLNYGFIHGDSVINDTILPLSFNTFGKDSLTFYVEDGTDSIFHHWFFEIPDLTSLKDKETVISNFNLRQNYPNPFNLTTNIRYDIPNVRRGFLYRVKIDIYNLLGQKIRTILDEKRDSGSHLCKLNTSDLSSGIYYYKILISDINNNEIYFSKVKKMMLLK